MRGSGRTLSLNLAGVRFEIDPINRERMALRIAGYEDTPKNVGSMPGSIGGAQSGATDAPAISVRITPDEIRAEKEYIIDYWRQREVRFPDDDESYFEFTALQKKVLPALIDHRILYLHGSAICVNRQGYLFTAPSGTGKSTHVRLWRERFGDEVITINDDKPLIRVENDEIYLCGSPWNGKHGIGCQMEVPLRAIVKLRRGNSNRIEPLSTAEAFRELYLETYHFEEKEKMQAVMAMLGQIIERIPCYSLHCNMESDAAETARAGIETKYLLTGAGK